MKIGIITDIHNNMPALEAVLPLLSGCEKISEDCRIDASCSFGDLKILVPRRFRVEAFPSTSFASVEFSGHPDETPEGTIFLNGKASFGSIHIQYI